MSDDLYHVHTAEALIRTIASRKHRHALDGDCQPPRLSIAISREAGTPATEVAYEIARQLGWHAFDHELVERVALDMGLRTGLLEAVDEKHVSWLTETIEMIGSVLAVSESGYVRHLVQTIVSLGAHGHCVIVGRGAAHLLPQSTTLRVRLVAPIADRAAYQAKVDGLSLRDAERKVNRLDHDRTRFVKDYFHKDPVDPRNYDMLLNTSRLSVPQVARLIIDGLEPLKAQLIDYEALAASA